MGTLSNVVDKINAYHSFVEERVKKSRSDPKYAQEILDMFNKIKNGEKFVGYAHNKEEIRRRITKTRSGTPISTFALPPYDEAGMVLRFLLEDNLPGRFPFGISIYPTQYIDEGEEPTRLFAGLGLPEDTRKRFGLIIENQDFIRLSTAFDGLTLYGLDSDESGMTDSVGEGGVAICTIDDIARLYHDLDLYKTSVSMTINGPAAFIYAMFLKNAERNGFDIDKLRGTVQTDILKEEQAQKEMIFPLNDHMRLISDMVSFNLDRNMKFYPISVSGYHIDEAGATPIEQAAFTLANGFTYVEDWIRKGLNPEKFGGLISFFFASGLDPEYTVLPKVARKIWAIGMRDAFEVKNLKSQMLRLHTQTSGRSLQAQIPLNNITRTTIEALYALFNYTNSLHTNSYDEPYTTPTERSVIIASHTASILLKETGLFTPQMGFLGGFWGGAELEKTVEKEILKIFNEIDELGGVIYALDYIKGRIKKSSLDYQVQIEKGERSIIGVNEYKVEGNILDVKYEHTPIKRQQYKADQVKAFKHKHRHDTEEALGILKKAALYDNNLLEVLFEPYKKGKSIVETCTIGQMTQALKQVWGVYRKS